MCKIDDGGRSCHRLKLKVTDQAAVFDRLGVRTCCHQNCSISITNIGNASVSSSSLLLLCCCSFNSVTQDSTTYTWLQRQGFHGGKGGHKLTVNNRVSHHCCHCDVGTVQITCCFSLCLWTCFECRLQYETVAGRKKKRRKLAGRVQMTSRSVRVVKLDATRQLTQAKIFRARPALMDLQVKMQVLGKCFKMCNVVFCTILQLFSE